MEKQQAVNTGSQKKQTHNNNIIKWSRIMTHTSALKLAGKGLFLLLALVLISSLVVAQTGNFTISGNQTNNGLIKVKRDIINNTTGMVTVSGTGVVRLDRTSDDHAIKSATGAYPITFSNLSMTDNRLVTAQTDVTVTSNLTIGDASGAYTNAGTGFSIGARTLNIANTSSYLATSTAALTFSGGTVNYTNATSQSVLVKPTGTTYGTLGLTGNANMTIPDATAGAFSVGTLTHSGSGTLTINDSATVTATATIGTLATVASGKLLDFAGTSGSTIATLTTSAGTIKNSAAQTLGITTMSGNAGIVENTNSSTLTIGTLSDNDGTIRNTNASGTLAFTNAAANGDGTISASAGTVTFSDNVTDNGTGNSLTLTGTSAMNFGGTVASDNYSFASGTTETFTGAAQSIPVATYGNLVAGGSADKSLAGNITVADNLTLTNSITTGANVLRMTSTTASNVSGAGEVFGSVRRDHSFTAGSNYAFNRDSVYMNFASTAAGDITLAMTPGGTPTSLTTSKYMARKYAITVGTNPGDLNAMQLYYRDGFEEQGSANEARLGIRQRVGGNWSKIFATGYTRTSGSGLAKISDLTGVSIASATEFAMTQADLAAIASANWADASTWDENLAPTSTDDLTITSYNVTIPSGAQSIASVDLQGTGTLEVAGGSLAVSKNLNITSGAGINLSGGTMTVTDSVVNAGDITVASGQSLTTALLHNNSAANTVTFTGNAVLDSLHNDGGTISFNGGATSIASAISNLSGAVINIGGTTSMLTASALTFSSAGNLSVNGGTLNIGNGSALSNLTMTTPSTLTLSNGTSYLYVFGNLELGTGTTLDNSGEITVGN
jgi:hypothetical protein